MRKGNIIKILAFVLLLLGFSAFMYIVFGLIENFSDKAEGNYGDEDGYSYSEHSGDQIHYEGQWYRPKDSVETILVLGIDKFSNETENRQDSEQSDFLALLVIDKDQKTYQILHINRDTMTDIEQTDAFGEVYGRIQAQLTLAHTYGETETQRCRNTVRAVENLLYGSDVNHYLSMTMDAVAMLNDSAGGVTLTLMDDFTFLDERFVKGAEVTLRGEQALSYVRARGGMEESTNTARMERQQQYVSAFLKKVVEIDSEQLVDEFAKISDHVFSDCTADQMTKVFERLKTYSYEGTVTLPGEAVKGTEYMEYHVDEQALQGQVVELFYELLD